MDIIGDLLLRIQSFEDLCRKETEMRRWTFSTIDQTAQWAIGPKQKHRPFMATINYRSAIEISIAFAVLFGSGVPAIAGTFAVAPSFAVPSVSIAHSALATAPSAEISPSQVGATANFSAVNHDAATANFSGATTAVTVPTFANVSAGLTSPMVGQTFTGSFGPPQSPNDPSSGGATGHEEVPGAPDMGAANSVSGSIANATGSPLISINSYSDGSAVRENQTIGPTNATGPANAVETERSLRYESYEYSGTVSDLGTRDLEKKPRICVLPGNAHCAIGIGLADKQCFCRTPEGPVNGISR